jgi:hypothetical protein
MLGQVHMPQNGPSLHIAIHDPQSFSLIHSASLPSRTIHRSLSSFNPDPTPVPDRSCGRALCGLESPLNPSKTNTHRICAEEKRYNQTSRTLRHSFTRAKVKLAQFPNDLSFPNSEFKHFFRHSPVVDVDRLGFIAPQRCKTSKSSICNSASATKNPFGHIRSPPSMTTYNYLK